MPRAVAEDGKLLTLISLKTEEDYEDFWMIHKCDASFNLVITGLKNELHRNFPLCSEIGDFFFFLQLFQLSKQSLIY